MALKTGIWAPRLEFGPQDWRRRRKSSIFVIDPFRAAALLPLNVNTNLLRQDTGTADHLTLLGLFQLIVAKVSYGQRYLLPLSEYMLCDGEWGSGPKGAGDLCSVIFGDLGLKASINNGI